MIFELLSTEAAGFFEVTIFWRFFTVFFFLQDKGFGSFAFFRFNGGFGDSTVDFGLIETSKGFGAVLANSICFMKRNG